MSDVKHRCLCNGDKKARNWVIEQAIHNDIVIATEISWRQKHCFLLGLPCDLFRKKHDASSDVSCFFSMKCNELHAIFLHAVHSSGMKQK
jgi:hypothetical protein